MERQMIITIGRCFGSNGRRIGERVAESMGIKFYDRNLIDLAAKKSGLERELVGSADERLIGRFLELRPGLDMLQESRSEKIYRAQAEVIRSIVRSGESCVIVGRGADYVLRNRPEVLKVYIYAPLESRIRTVMKRYDFNEEEAEKVIRHMDKTRRNYYEYFTDRNWDQKEGKDLLLDSSEFGIRGTAELIRAAAEMKQERDWDV
ncbi:MAG: cytidylate kinase-like family protein [Eubacteriales bacterium]|nr:cytidylate kinase-like family protein [Eubacteriales bacterium]